jgi:hypothetical protein
MHRLLAGLATLLLFTIPAHADTKSWTAVKGKLPTGTVAVMSFDVAQIAKTSVYQTAVQTVLDQEEDAKQGFELIKTGCGVDITSVVTDVTVVIADVKEHDGVLIAVGVNGVDKAKLTACMTAIASIDHKDAKLTAKTKGKVTDYSVAGKSEHVYVGWLTKDVIAFTDDPMAKGKLEKMIVGKPAKGALKKFLAKTTSTSAAFFAVSEDEKSDVGTMKGGYGGLDIAGGNLSLKITAVADSAASASAFADKAKSELKDNADQVRKQMPDLAKLFDATQFATNETEITVTNSASEKALGSLIPALASMMK